MKLDCEAKRELTSLLVRLRDKRHQAERRLKGYQVKIDKINQESPYDHTGYSFLRGSIMELEFQLQDLNIIELHLSELEV